MFKFDNPKVALALVSNQQQILQLALIGCGATSPLTLKQYMLLVAKVIRYAEQQDYDSIREALAVTFNVPNDDKLYTVAIHTGVMCAIIAANELNPDDVFNVYDVVTKE